MDERRQKQRRKKEPLLKRLASALKRAGTLNLVLFCVFAFFLYFNFQMLELFKTYGTIPENYACAVIAATIGECGICGWIRTNKDRQREREWEREEQRRQEQEAEDDPPEENETAQDIQEVENG